MGPALGALVGAVGIAVGCLVGLTVGIAVGSQFANEHEQNLCDGGLVKAVSQVPTSAAGDVG